MNKSLIAVALSAAMLSACAGTTGSSSSAVATDIESNASYLSDKSGNVITSGSGVCVTNGTFSADDTLIACDPEAAAKAAADAEAAAKAEAERAAAEAARQAEADAAAAAAAAAAANQAAPQVMTLNGKAHFETESAALGAEGEMALSRLADQLKSYDSIEKISIIGHTDNTGDESFNQRLSERRAATVRCFLDNAGVLEGAVVDVMGRGESAPIADNSTAEGRLQNRRVDIEVTGTR